MPIRNEKGLAALKALSTGGSAGLDAYKQAQASEAASRTSALQGALGSNDVAAAAQKAQAQFSPKVSGGLGIGNLDVAADSYLSQASNKLAAKQYEDQQNLALQTEALKRQETEISAADRMNQLKGAAEIMAEQQRGDLQQGLLGGEQLQNLAARKAGLREQLTAFDQQAPVTTPALAATLAAAGTPEAAARLQELNAMAGQRQAQRQDILNQMGALDQQYADASGQYAGLLGTDNKGFLEAYAKADQGDAEAIKGLNQFLAPRQQEAALRGANEIAMGGQERLRALAPAFGINELTAAGQFREGEGNDLARQNAIAAQDAFITGTSGAQQAAADEENANQFGFTSGKDFSAFKKSVDMGDKDIENTLGSSEWGVLGQLSDAITNGREMFEVPGSGQKLPLGTGREGLTEAIQQLVNNEQNPLVHPDGKPYSEAEKAKLVQLATKYYGTKVFGVQGKGEAAEAE